MKLPGAKCEGCPLESKPCVAPQIPKSHPSLIVISDQPGHQEVIENQPLVGASGFVFEENLRFWNAPRSRLHISNAVACYPDSPLKPSEWKRAIACCQPRLDTELGRYRSDTWILLLGSKALQAMCGESAVTRWAGAELRTRGNRRAIVCPNPSLVFSKSAYRPAIRAWMGRAIQKSTNDLQDWEWPEYHIHPGPGATRELRRMLEEKNPVGVDVETAGIDPMTCGLMCIGLADRKGGVSLPWPLGAGDLALVRAILTSDQIEKVAHNAQHDILSLKYQGLDVRGPVFDTLLAHAVTAPQLPHGLQFVALLDYPTEPWKTQFKVTTDLKGSDVFVKRDPLELRAYNFKDSYMTALLRDSLLRHLGKRHNGWELYREYVELSKVAMAMRERGIKTDAEKFGSHRENIVQQLDKYRALFHEQPETENYQLGKNGQHRALKKLFFKDFGVQPSSYSKLTGEPKLDATQLQDIIAGTSERAALLARIILRYRQWYKLLSTYIDGIERDRDGIVYPVWKVYGTITGRWSSASPNMQNVPKQKLELIKDPEADGGYRRVEVTPALRDLFIPRQGLEIVECDYSQLELRIMALLAQDELLLEWYNDNQDVHSKNAEALFGSGFTKKQRDLAKQLAYAFNYNASDDVSTVWKSLVVSFPTLKLMDVRRLRKAWFEAHPAIRVWQNRQISLARRLDYVEEYISGRREYFFGAIEPNKVLNFPIQGLAGTLMNRAIVNVYQELKQSNDHFLLLQVHDALIGESRKPQELIEIFKRHMEQEIEVEGQRIRFPVDAQIGQSWGSMVEVS